MEELQSSVETLKVEVQHRERREGELYRGQIAYEGLVGAK